MLRTYDRFASPPECAATSNAGCGGGGGVIGAKDRPGNLTGASDPEVVAWAKQGHEAAFRELVRRYERPIFSLLYRMVRDRALAEDLAQETFIKVLNAIGTYNPQFKFSSWIFKIANNTAIDHLRRRELETLSLDGSPHATTPDEVELWAQGLLPAARDTHLAQCAECRTIAARERKLIRELSQLTRFTPEFGFVERVMAKVKIPTPSGPHLRPHTDA